MSSTFPHFYVETVKNLRRAATLAIDGNVRAAATKLQDHKLLSKLAVGDTHAQDAYILLHVMSHCSLQSS